MAREREVKSMEVNPEARGEPRRWQLRDALVFTAERVHNWGVEKKSLRRLKVAADKLKALPHLDESERLLYARSLLASPQKRWEMHENYLRLLNLFSYFERKKSASWSRE